MHVEVPAITRAEMLADADHAETSAVVAARVAAARRRAAARYAGTPWRTNGQVPPVELRRRWPVPRSSCADVDRALELGALTARGYGRVLRLAWTLADLAEADVPGRGARRPRADASGSARPPQRWRRERRRAGAARCWRCRG